jgi:hypothetical protein
MADRGDFLSREEVLGGLPARRARTLLFLIEQHSALHASEREVGTMALLGERSAETRGLEWIEAFALGQEAPRTPSIREIEAASERWAPLVAESPEVRAAVLRQLAERHRLQYKRVPGIRGALGADDRRVAEAFERQTEEPLESIWTARIGALDRLRWALSAPGRWLERAPPFQAAAALTFLLSMGQTVVIVPIAVATVGPLAAAASIAVIGLLALAATAAVAEAAARSGEVRFRAGFFGRLVTSSLGPGAGAVPSMLGIAGVALPTLSAFIGLGLLLNLAVPLPAELWVVVIGAMAVAVPLASQRTASFGGLMALGLVSVALLAVLSTVALVNGALSGGLSTPELGPPNDIGLEIALGVIIGVLLGSYADPVYTVQIGRIVLPRDPGGREYVRGSVAGMAAFIVLTAVFSVALLFSVPAGELAGERGSALDTVAEELGPGAVVLGVVIGIGLFGIRLYGNAIALFDFVAERLPGRPATRVVLRAGRGRVLLGRPGHRDATRVALAYPGISRGRPQLELTLSGGGSRRTSTVPLPRPGEEEPVEAGAEELSVEVLEADERALHVGLRTSMSISYDGEQDMLGPGIAESLLAGDEDARLAGWLLREGEAAPAAAARNFGWPEEEARRRLQAMADAGRARALENGNYVAQMAARRGRRVDPELWTRLGAEEAERRPEAEPGGPLQWALASSVGRATICSLPTAALAAAAAALILAGSASVAGPIRIVGIIAFATISGVLPPMLVVAARRRSDVVTAPSRVLAGTALMAVTGITAIAVIILHATVLWSDPVERALAAAATIFALVSLILAARHGAFKPAAVLEFRQTADSGPVRIRGQEGGRDLELGISEQVDHEAEFSLEPGSLPIRIHGRTTTAAELRISALRLDASGRSAALPITIALPRQSSVQMAEIGGMTTFAVEPGDWTVEVRPEEATDSRATGSPLERL